MKIFYEQGKLNKHWIDDYCKSNWLKCRRYHMEERGEDHSNEMLPDGSIDKNLSVKTAKKR